MSNRYRIAVWHGEGSTLFYIVDSVNDEIVETFRSQEEAQDWTAHQNGLLDNMPIIPLKKGHPTLKKNLIRIKKHVKLVL